MKRKLLSRKRNSNSLSANQSVMSESSLDLSSTMALTTPDVITKFWRSFEKFAVSQPGKFETHNSLFALALPVTSLLSALQLMSTVNIEAEVQHLIAPLNLSESESLSWVEYRDLCSRLFCANESVSSASLGPRHRHSRQSPSSPSRESQRNELIGSKAYDRLLRINRTANTIPHSVSEPSLAESCQSEKTSSLNKDSLCQVMKEEYRKIRRAQESGEPLVLSHLSPLIGTATARIDTAIPRYQSDLQKKKILTVVNPVEGRPKRWKQVRQMKINEAVRDERLAHRTALIQHLKTVVVAQDR
jgi:hypothetical protein